MGKWWNYFLIIFCSYFCTLYILLKTKDIELLNFHININIVINTNNILISIMIYDFYVWSFSIFQIQ